MSLDRLKRWKILELTLLGEVRAGCLGSMAASFQFWKFGREVQAFFHLFGVWGDLGKQSHKTYLSFHYNPIKGSETVGGWEEKSSGFLVRLACLPPASRLSELLSICQAITTAAFMSKHFFFNELVPNVYFVLGTLCSEAVL